MTKTSNSSPVIKFIWFVFDSLTDLTPTPRVIASKLTSCVGFGELSGNELENGSVCLVMKLILLEGVVFWDKC